MSDRAIALAAEPTLTQAPGPTADAAIIHGLSALSASKSAGVPREGFAGSIRTIPPTDTHPAGSIVPSSRADRPDSASVAIPLDTWRELTTVLCKLHEILPGLVPESTRSLCGCAIHSHPHPGHSNVSSFHAPDSTSLSAIPSISSLSGSVFNPIDLCGAEGEEPSTAALTLDPSSSPTPSTSPCTTSVELPDSAATYHGTVIIKAPDDPPLRNDDVPAVEDSTKAGPIDSSTEIFVYNEEEYNRRRAQVLAVKIQARCEQSERARKEVEMKKKRKEIMAAKAAAWDQKRTLALLRKSLADEQDELKGELKASQVTQTVAWEETGNQAMPTAPQHDSLPLPLPSELSSPGSSPTYERASTVDLFYANKLELLYPPEPPSMALDLPLPTLSPAAPIHPPEVPMADTFTLDDTDNPSNRFDIKPGVMAHSLPTTLWSYGGCPAPFSTTSPRITADYGQVPTRQNLYDSQESLRDYNVRSGDEIAPHPHISERAISRSLRRASKEALTIDCSEGDLPERGRSNASLINYAVKKTNAASTLSPHVLNGEVMLRGTRGMDPFSLSLSPTDRSTSFAARISYPPAFGPPKSTSPRKRKDQDNPVLSRPAHRLRYTNERISSSSTYPQEASSVLLHPETIRTQVSSDKTYKPAARKVQEASPSRPEKTCTIGLYSNSTHALTTSGKAYKHRKEQEMYAAASSSSAVRTAFAVPHDGSLHSRISAEKSYMSVADTAREPVPLLSRLDL